MDGPQRLCKNNPKPREANTPNQAAPVHNQNEMFDFWGLDTGFGEDFSNRFRI